MSQHMPQPALCWPKGINFFQGRVELLASLEQRKAGSSPESEEGFFLHVASAFLSL